MLIHRHTINKVESIACLGKLSASPKVNYWKVATTSRSSCLWIKAEKGSKNINRLIEVLLTELPNKAERQVDVMISKNKTEMKLGRDSIRIPTKKDG